MRVSWEPGREKDLAGYHLYRSTAETGSYNRLNLLPLTGASFMDTDLTQGRMYFYQVSAVDTTGNESAITGPAAPSPTWAPRCLCLTRRVSFRRNWTSG